jgi:hypothetical protein
MLAKGQLTHQHITTNTCHAQGQLSVLLLGYGERNDDGKIKGMGKEYGRQERWR